MSQLAPTLGWTDEREHLLASQSEALGRRIRGVLKEELASLRRHIGQGSDPLPHRDELRAIVTTHAEREGDLFQEFLTRSAYAGFEAGWSFVDVPPLVDLAPAHVARVAKRSRTLADAFRRQRQQTIGTVMLALEYGGPMARVNAAGVLTSEYDQHMRLGAVVSATEVAVAHQLGAMSSWVVAGVQDLQYVIAQGCETDLCEPEVETAHPTLMTDGEPVLDAVMPPFHPGCHCFCVPI